MGKNWKTTLGGLLTSVGVALSQVDDPYVKSAGSIMMIVGSLLLGLSAKDRDVTGGHIPQPTPPGVREEALILGREEKRAEVKKAQ